MKLSEIFKNYTGEDVEISGIKTNSNAVSSGDLFVCIKGVFKDRHDYIDDAIKNGASAIVVSKDVETSIPTIKVKDTNKELVNILKVFYDNPQDKLTIIGITGTDGKTTSAKIIQHLLGNDICGYIGTIGIDCRYFVDKTNNTTPPAEKLFEAFARFVKCGIKYVALEASSEAFFYHRLDGINFSLGCFTNITSDHLNTHKTLENYINCKKKLFINSDKQVLNSNDLHFNEIKSISKDYLTYGFNDFDTLRINSYTLYPNKTSINLSYCNNTYEFETSLLGKFNVENIALSILTLIRLGYEIEDLLPKTRNLIIPGRMQAINNDKNFFCIVDYAHTTNSIQNVLEFANMLKVNSIKVITGQAGGRDQIKRKDIGKIILDNSTYAYLTEDDPRFEKVEDIINMMLEDTDKTNYEIILSRKDAIKKAIHEAQENDLLLFLGKGVDKYMAIEDRRDSYDEIEEILNALKSVSTKDFPSTN